MTKEEKSKLFMGYYKYPKLGSVNNVYICVDTNDFLDKISECGYENWLNEVSFGMPLILDSVSHKDSKGKDFLAITISVFRNEESKVFSEENEDAVYDPSLKLYLS